MSEHNKESIIEIRKKLQSSDVRGIDVLWGKLSKEEQKHIRQEIGTLPDFLKRELYFKLNMVNEHLSSDIIGSGVIPPTVYMDGRYYDAKDIRDTCVQDVRAVPRFVISIFSLPESEKKMLMSQIEEIDKPFYRSMLASVSRVEEYSQNTVNKVKNKGNKSDDIGMNVERTPITYLASYVENKAEVLALYRKKLEEKGLTSDLIDRVIEIEANLIGPQDLG